MCRPPGQSFEYRTACMTKSRQQISRPASWHAQPAGYLDCAWKTSTGAISVTPIGCWPLFSKKTALCRHGPLSGLSVRMHRGPRLLAISRSASFAWFRNLKGYSMPLNHSLVLLPIILLTWWALFNFHPKMLSQHALNGLGALALLGMGL